MLGPLAFVVYINDIDDLTKLILLMKKFADDTKLGHRALSATDRALLQECLDNLLIWADKWGMEFNVEKCKVMHIGRNNPSQTYKMRGLDLEKVEMERDIGVLIHSSLKPSKQCSDAARRATAVLEQIARSFHYRDRHTFLQLYKQYVRVHLEFSVPAWSPWSIVDIDTLEKVQQRAVNMVSGCNTGSYQDKLKSLGLQSLKDRRIRYDMIETFKMLNGFSRVDYTTFFEIVGDRPAVHTRNTSYHQNIVRTNARSEVRRNFFTNRVPPIWNNLPTFVKQSTSVKMFRTRYDKYIGTTGPVND